MCGDGEIWVFSLIPSWLSSHLPPCIPICVLRMLRKSLCRNPVREDPRQAFFPRVSVTPPDSAEPLSLQCPSYPFPGCLEPRQTLSSRVSRCGWTCSFHSLLATGFPWLSFTLAHSINTSFRHVAKCCVGIFVLSRQGFPEGQGRTEVLCFGFEPNQRRVYK